MASSLPVRVYATDAVAGYGSNFKTSQLRPGDTVLFVVEKPDGSVMRLPAKADLAGVAQADFFGHQTKQAGVYKVAVTYPNSASASPQSTFQVVPDRPSLTQSTINSVKSMVAADSRDTTFVTVTLLDAYRNAVKNHSIQLISSRSDDVIESLSQPVTDAEGRVNFRVASRYAGISVYSALDVTLGQVLTDRHEVVFFAPVDEQRAIGGNSFTADLTNSSGNNSAPPAPDALSGPIDHFDIVDLPSTVKVGEDKYVTVVARDKNKNIARNYTGTILISVPEDENATLPNSGEYTFKASDQGKFTFNLALRFSRVGKQVVQVFDKNDWRIAGEFPVEVVPTQAVVTPQDGLGTLKIKSPADEAELGSNLLIISGQGDPNINLKIFDNDVKIGDSQTDTDGFFTFQAKDLENGMHSFYAMSEANETSPPVHVKIDTLPPVINQFEMKPDGVVDPGSKIEVTVYSEPKLESVKVRLQGAEQDLQEKSDQPGAYLATLTAPTVIGTFPVDVILIDVLSNKAELLNKGTISVNQPKKNLPPAVFGVTGEAGDSKVILHWEAASTFERPVKNYRIAYGATFTELIQIMDVPSSSLTSTVGSLSNDHQYFFAVSAVDDDGQEGPRSVVIAVTPTVSRTATLAPVSALAGLQGEALNGSASLFWTPNADPRVHAYRIYFGLKSGAYDDHIVTPDARPTALVSDLIDGLPYYFAVSGLDATGQEVSALSNELQLVPGSLAAHPASVGSTLSLNRIPRTNETGSESIWLVALSVFFSTALYRHKRRLTTN